MNRKLHGNRPQPGDILRVNYHAWLVLTVSDLPAEPDDNITRPYRIEMEPLTGPTERVPHKADIRKWVSWEVLGEHYALCHKCGEVPPCREQQRATYAAQKAVELEKALRLPEGACPACSEPITTRQRTYVFPGPNLLNPLARDGVAYHARRQCRGAAARYEDMWVAADPSRERSLLTLRCSGTVTVHADGTGECYGRTGGDCPNIYAQHRGAQACYVGLGCGKGCAPSGHPGTLLAPDLAPEGYRAHPTMEDPR